MSFLNYATREIHIKIVYYGPGLCGKTTNVQYIFERSTPESKGRMISLKTDTERTLFFDFVPLDIGKVAGFRVRLLLYTTPGQIFYQATRKLVLDRLDGLVFVADSQTMRLDADVESMEDLHDNLRERGVDPADLPMVLQYNKRDLEDVASVGELRELLNPMGVPEFEAAASSGVGVFDTLKGVSKLALRRLEADMSKKR